jgi:hypothetical protein
MNPNRKTVAKYSEEEIITIIEGYRIVDHCGTYSKLLKKVSQCKDCALNYPTRSDHPLNFLVRSLPLNRLLNKEDIQKYTRRIKRDDSFLRILLSNSPTIKKVYKNIYSAKFSVGLLPWLDRCMLFRSNKRTKLMVLGIDFKHFPVFFQQQKDHNFPCDTYLKKNNIWGPSWKRFWVNLLGKPYSDEKVNTFISRNGVYFTNSMLCFGGSPSPAKHSFEYIECCRKHIAEQLSIIRPEILVSFGNYGCRNAVSILLPQNQDNEVLNTLSKDTNPLRLMKTLIKSERKIKKGVRLKYNSQQLTYWPLYQPARNHRYDSDYKVLQNIMNIKPSSS